MFERLKKGLKKLFGFMGDDVIGHVVVKVFETVLGGKDVKEKAGRAAEMTAEFLVQTLKEERPIEGYAVMVKEIRPYWRRAVRFFRTNGGDDRLERVIGDIWTSCQNGVFYLKLHGNKTVRREANDGKELFVTMMKEIFRPSATDDDIRLQLDMCYQASPWERLVNLGRKIGQQMPSFGTIIRTLTFTKPGFTMVPNPNPAGRMFLSVQETEDETTARAIRRLILFITLLFVIAVCLGVTTLIIALFIIPFAIYSLVVTPFGASTVGVAIADSFIWVFILLATAPIGWKFFHWIGIVQTKKGYAMAVLVIAGLAIAIRLALAGPALIHEARIASGNIVDTNSVFMHDGKSRFCRPVGDLSPTGENGNWWMAHVYACDAENPGSSRIGIEGQPLTPKEGIEWLQYKQQLDRSENKGGWFDWFEGPDDTPKQSAPVATIVPATSPRKLLVKYFQKEGSAAVARIIEICREESGLRHYNDNGTILRGTDNPEDIGMCQINATFHGGVARNIGIDPYDHTIEEHARLALAVFINAGRNFSPWQRTVDKLEDRSRSIQPRYGVLFAAPGNGEWGEEVVLSEAIRSHLKKQLLDLGKNEPKLLDRMMNTFEFERFDKLIVPEDNVWARLDGGPPIKLGQPGVISKFFDRIQIKTENADPYVNMYWVYFPEVD